jgi:hypothetical protein
MDAKETFLHGGLKEEIYMTQLQDYIENGKESLVCKFKNYLDGLVDPFSCQG